MVHIRNLLPIVLVCAIASLLGACDGGIENQQNIDCMNQATGNLRWGYYPGYGCGPVPPAQTKFSDAKDFGSAHLGFAAQESPMQEWR